jgi:hypothetical protein
MWKWAAVVLAVGLVLLGAILPLAWPRPSHLTGGNFERVKAGMSRADVETILGPPDDYTTGPTNIRSIPVSLTPPSGSPEFWMGDEGDATVWFDAADRVVGSHFLRTGPLEVNAAYKLRWRLERRLKGLVR